MRILYQKLPLDYCDTNIKLFWLLLPIFVVAILILVA
jgi:hypothetical protein